MRNILFLVILTSLLNSCGQSTSTSNPAATTPAQDTVPVFLLHTDTLKKASTSPANCSPGSRPTCSPKSRGM
ncbi:hypothetical protein ACQ86N_29870 [Puia sp. P3]|uniref:hypothetical protein n=1 Tax=Puia sp. P3 TaxID=3423952 RepID=UPI003D6736AC